LLILSNVITVGFKAYETPWLYALVHFLFRTEEFGALLGLYFLLSKKKPAGITGSSRVTQVLHASDENPQRESAIKLVKITTSQTGASSEGDTSTH
jgi:hypothetical protein